MLVVKDKYGMWSSPCSNKDKTVTYWLSVSFGGNEPNTNKAFIEPTKSFHSAYAKRDGTACPKLVIMEFKYSQNKNGDDISLPHADKTIEIDTDALPFY